ncbi:hypothetical protein ASPVEDRAFT_187638 [Aspergillus versicolor CBS 583.65]|uniref:Uncharacterized protein n=1 Tax=Aspergillus versicolor CBS 583.65 TaxID=1036611 RepID=A0A1L9PDC9_ASPVE|nr:uncharacterized protein ASPVEDRAFT_187638 [Aspergillus versicolor CBS 583.65]OJI99465.1 hypothetical protein ASPVEDRAFT_187638 [Aspergillus versicolor CBS 583.65]
MSPFDVLSTYLTFPSNDQDQWWRRTGPLVGRLLSTTGYTAEQQYQFLTFYHNQLIPRLGPCPATFHSSITVTGLPMEFSVNYQEHGGHPTVRIGAEPVDSFSGTDRDPFNQAPPALMVSHLARIALNGFDPQLYGYFEPKHTLTRDEQIRLPTSVPGGAKLRTQHAMGFDLKDTGITVKGYTYPGLKAHMSGQDIKQLLTVSVTDLKAQGKMDCVDAWSKLAEYITETNGWGYHNLWAWDYIDPAKSRFKFYTFVMDVSDSKLEELWTLNNRATGPAHMEGLFWLRKLWDVIDLRLAGKRDLPADAPQVPENSAPMLWNYELTPGNPLPYGKAYFPLQGLNDLVCVEKIARFFRMLGWTELAASYRSTVESFYPDYDLSKTSHLVFWISFAYSERTGVYVSVYYHPCPEK